VEGGVDRYIELSEQPTAVEADARDAISLFRGAGFRVARVRRHGRVAAPSCGIRYRHRRALYEAGGDARKLAANAEGVGTFILAVREGWSALDRRGVKSAPLALRTIFCWAPLPYAVGYWQRLLGSARGEFYFARHTRHAPKEMAALAADVRELLALLPVPCLDRLYSAINQAVQNSHSVKSRPT
jgi:hypothetical protein